jgi:hypothetical protein
MRGDKRGGGNTECNLWREKWVSTVGRVSRGGDLSCRLTRESQDAEEVNNLTMDLIYELYSPKIAKDSMDDEGDDWGCSQCTKRH